MPPKKTKKKRVKKKKVEEIPTAPEAELADLAQFDNLRIPEDSDAKRELADELKTAGNRWYAAANYEKAVELYTKSINLHQDYKCFGNRSAAYLKVGKVNDAVADAAYFTKNRPLVRVILLFLLFFFWYFFYEFELPSTTTESVKEGGRRRRTTNNKEKI